MSLSQPKISSPCKKFIDFKGSTGNFQFWDKSKKENIELKLPLRFIVLDELSTITGYSESANSGIYSNEVHNLSHQDLNVRTFKGGISFSGKYADIKTRISDLGGKFSKSIYAALITGDGVELVNFKFKGASLKPWIDRDSKSNVVKIEGCLDGKKGVVKYKSPIFLQGEADENHIEEALELDKELQIYLKSHKPQVDEAIQPDAKEETEDQVF